MSEITEAITAKQTQIRSLQSEIDTLQSAASILGRTASKAKVSSQKTASQPRTKRKIKQRRRKPSGSAKGSPAKPKITQRRKPTWSAADRAAISKRMKAYWAKRRKAKQ